jgi:hypothetical protein
MIGLYPRDPCPDSGRIVALWRTGCHTARIVPTDGDPLEPLLDHLQRSSPLRRSEAERVVQDVLAWFSEDGDAFVRRRHRELQRRGVPNAEAYTRIAAELAARPVPGPRLTVRQVRRVIYG